MRYRNILQEHFADWFSGRRGIGAVIFFVAGKKDQCKRQGLKYLSISNIHNGREAKLISDSFLPKTVEMSHSAYESGESPS